MYATSNGKLLEYADRAPPIAGSSSPPSSCSRSVNTSARSIQTGAQARSGIMVLSPLSCSLSACYCTHFSYSLVALGPRIESEGNHPVRVGGVSQIESDATDASRVVRVAIAGPIAEPDHRVRLPSHRRGPGAGTVRLNRGPR